MFMAEGELSDQEIEGVPHKVGFHSLCGKLLKGILS